MPIAKNDAHRIALRPPFEAYMPRDVFPPPCEPRLAPGKPPPTSVEDADRDRNRRDLSLFEHERPGVRLAQQLKPFVECFMEPRGGWADDRARSATRFDRFL